MMNQPAPAPIEPQDSPPTDGPASLWDKLDALSAAGPVAEWLVLPADLARNVKHYLDGQPKR